MASASLLRRSAEGPRRVLVVGERRRLPRADAVRLGLEVVPLSPAPAIQLLRTSPPDAMVVGASLEAAARRQLHQAVADVAEADRPAVVEASGSWQGLADRLHAALEVRALSAALARKDAELRHVQERLELLVARTTEELRLAGNVQRSLLPGPAQHAGLEVAREFIPFREVGGDYYDFLPLGPHRLAFALGDVMGKGIPAALLAAGLKAAVRAQLQSVEEAPDPGEVVSRVNRLFREIAPSSLFASLFFAVFDTARGVVDYVSAGHPYPFCVRRDGGVEELAVGGTLLGLVEAAGYEQGRLAFGKGDVLVFFTDGVTDRTDALGEVYGVERLTEAALRSRSDAARIVLYSLLGDVQGFSSGTPAQDDATLVVVRVL